MEEKGLISIIIPVYNVSDYLDSCVMSVIRQTYSQWELLLVDDESTDGSSSMCDTWASKDSRITVIHHQHAGPAVTRNTGIAASKGEYLYFMDSDDWIETDTLAYMLDCMSQYSVDIVGCGVFFDYPTYTKKKAYVKKNCVLPRSEALRMIITGALPSYLPLLLWRRDVVKEPYVDVPCYEDYATGYKWFSHADKVMFSTEAKYHYIQRKGSILHTNRRDKFLIDIYRDRHNYILQHGLMAEDECRAVTVKNFLKLAKDFARKPFDFDERLDFVIRVRNYLKDYLPVGLGQLGLKRWVRLQLLKASPSCFVRIV